MGEVACESQGLDIYHLVLRLVKFFKPRCRVCGTVEAVYWNPGTKTSGNSHEDHRRHVVHCVLKHGVKYDTIRNTVRKIQKL